MAIITVYLPDDDFLEEFESFDALEGVEELSELFSSCSDEDLLDCLQEVGFKPIAFKAAGRQAAKDIKSSETSPEELAFRQELRAARTELTEARKSLRDAKRALKSASKGRTIEQIEESISRLRSELSLREDQLEHCLELKGLVNEALADFKVAERRLENLERLIDQ